MRLKISLVVEEEVMIPQNESPVLQNPGLFGNKSEVVAKTVNFLRCGCPSVQLISGNPYSEQLAKDMLDKFQGMFSSLQKPGEQFEIQAPSGRWSQESIITITRIVASDRTIPPHPNLIEIEQAAIKQTLERGPWTQEEAARVLKDFRMKIKW
ncbi:MAG: hypothetical protein A3F53_00035 [Candidatus Zambryskibacteria bacterium RIFCSPHIGHO2_12_FULL_48_10]|uniref:Uncharacterized protein n=1 Tax=Candidatus Zambryskibacteria bacterium RIFCSPHIGHO2_01_FULL_46_25 TaxID=1802738 RepID=A0A1G2SZP9_9BACT|nr:MAG: hypothetical protein UX71_C0005G0017 [Parcubacteria group bacterium GW2011_GWA1_47_10]OHA90332.1 MAG: hypothetical protein A2838_01895 [Candidatus Zambryskibacteria bacterium RIFCSPHIGHO2_01_FULL_46_25]OHB01269.1 MAG: hypothetical protein A3F53_00035 [Candidatus Zambryskibacteria bacterium RIFCSPHIGHO2_12_FULL_48_10]OHB06873.1 MAG: hypothetical protein A3A31_01045 [Candidatus Zambryskibacteria bacterium RIFCSPLOWO2_01_FULL_48_25]